MPDHLFPCMLWIDTETTGLTPGFHEVFQFGAILTDSEGKPFTGIEPLEALQPIFYPGRAEVAAFTRNGVPSADEWNRVHGERPGIRSQFEKWLEYALPCRDDTRKVIVAGWNPAFDDRMLRQSPGSEVDLIRLRGFDYHLLDVWSLAYHLLGPKAGSLEGCASLLGLDLPPHEALGDADLARRVWIELDLMSKSVQTR